MQTQEGELHLPGRGVGPGHRGGHSDTDMGTNLQEGGVTFLMRKVRQHNGTPTGLGRGTRASRLTWDQTDRRM